jgi:hypothetical protein
MGCCGGANYSKILFYMVQEGLGLNLLEKTLKSLNQTFRI